jgi:hypothetical protein
MYLRNVKQIFRQAEGGFDERRYGFGGLMDLLKALQRESLVRIERDRRGGLRVFQGQALSRPTPSSVMEGLPLVDPALEAAEYAEAASSVEIQPGEPAATEEPSETEQPEGEPMPIDTTAELLGRRTRKPRAGRTPRAAAAGKRSAAKKPATRRPRAKKPATDSSNEPRS